MILILLVGLLFLLGCGAMFGYTILKPFILAAEQARLKPHDKRTRENTRLHLCDLFTLSLLVVIPVAIFSNLLRESVGRDIGPFQVVLGIMICLCVYVWWRIAIALSAVGVSHSAKRFVMMGIVVPAAIIGSALGVPWLLISTVSTFQFGLTSFAVWLVAFALVVVAAFAGRAATKWVIGESEFAVLSRGEATDRSIDDNSANTNSANTNSANTNGANTNGANTNGANTDSINTIGDGENTPAPVDRQHRLS